MKKIVSFVFWISATIGLMAQQMVPSSLPKKTKLFAPVRSSVLETSSLPAMCYAGPNQKLISGKVFNDSNQDGINTLENGIPGITVFLFADRNNNGVPDPADSLWATTTTDLNGNYTFVDSVVTRQYREEFSGSVFLGTNNNFGTDNWASDYWFRDGINGNATDVQSGLSGDTDDDIGGLLLILDDNDAGAYRLVDLSRATSATLTFDWDIDAAVDNAGEGFFVQISTDNGGSYTTVFTYTDATGNSPAAMYEVINLDFMLPTSAPTASSSKIRFITNNFLQNGENIWIDNVTLTVQEEIFRYLVVLDTINLPGNATLTTLPVFPTDSMIAGTCDTNLQFGIYYGFSPTASNDTIVIPEDNGGTVIDVQSNDADANGDLLVTSIITGLSNGGMCTVINNDSIYYAPASNFSGMDSITYQICDPGGLCDTARVLITVEPLSDHSLINTSSDSSVTVCADTLVNFGNDSVVSIAPYLSPVNGSVLIAGNCLTYTPNSTFSGLDSFWFIFCSGNFCDTAVVSVVVGPVLGDLPVAVDDSASCTTSSITISILDNDSIPPDTVSIFIVDSGYGGSLDFTDYKLTYSPFADFCGKDSLQYVIQNTQGSDTAWIIISVIPVDSDQDGIPDYVETRTLDSDQDGILNYLSLDSDGDGLPDSVEALGDLKDPCQILLLDTDADNIPDYIDSDDDGDFILTIDELDPDNDGRYNDCDSNGIFDYLDPNPCEDPVAGKDITIPEGFSPNGDGTNDLFVIEGLSAYPNNAIKIFNRWGNEVFSAAPYHNDWNGTNSFGASLSHNNELPEGTYFYIFHSDSKTKNALKGYIYIKR